MKKILSVFLVAGILVACDDAKKDETKEVSTTKETTTETKTEGTDASGDTKTTTTTTTAVEVPKFADAEVQKMADEYAAFISEAKNMTADPAKLEEYNKKALEWGTKSQDVMKKLAASPEELKKFSDFMTKAAMAAQPK